MGLYDSIFIKVKCPYCGMEELTECQTKELYCVLQNWRKGQHVGDETISHLTCIVSCRSEECLEHEFKRIGYRSGYGRTYWLKVNLDEGRITGEYEITEAND